LDLQGRDAYEGYVHKQDKSMIAVKNSNKQVSLPKSLYKVYMRRSLKLTVRPQVQASLFIVQQIGTSILSLWKSGQYCAKVKTFV